MGTEYTFANWTKYFNNLSAAKKHCLKDYESHRGESLYPFKWIRENNEIRSPDLGFVMYRIKKIKTED